MKQTILVVEDDDTLSEMLEYNLAKQGYEVIVSKDGRSGINAARQHQPDLMVLDVMLPGIDGFEVCRILRKEMTFPILMLTARVEEIDKIVGLEMGADDYLTKPFSMRELIARVKAQLRRNRILHNELAQQTTNDTTEPAQPRKEMFVFGNLQIDPNRREVLIDEQAIRIKPKEFDLLLFLARHHGIALSRDLILERVWGWTYDGNSRTVDVHIRWLREKIEVEPSQAVRIVTVRGIGYRFDG